MKIAVADNNNGKFTKDLMNHWVAKGHEVRFERGASEFLAQWANIYYVDTWDNNAHYLYRLYHGQHDDMPPDWDNNKKPRIVVRALDWEIWLGHMRDQAMVDWVDDIIFIAPHIQDRVASEVKMNGKDRLIRPGVNLDIFTLKIKETDGFQLGMVLGDLYWWKNHMGGLDIFTQLYRQDPRWRLHIRGQHEGGTDWWRVMMEHYVNSRGITDAVLLYDQVDDMNEWYENIDILLHPGMKEAFCYAVGEAMAKGIPAIVNEFYGSRDIWINNMLYQTHEEAINKIMNGHNNLDNTSKNVFRSYIESNYDAKRMFEEYDQLLNL